VLQLDEQRSAGDVGQDPVPVEFLVAFVRHLIRNNPSGDCLALAIYAAAGEFSITNEQARKFIQAVMHEKENSPWPKGFF
jgi:hypothetical protein